MPRIGPSGEIIINGWLSKMIAGVATAGVLGGFAGLMSANSLAQDYHNHKDHEMREIAEIRAKVDKMWEEQVENRALQRTTQEEIGRARERQDRIEEKINQLLIKQGINPEGVK